MVVIVVDVVVAGALSLTPKPWYQQFPVALPNVQSRQNVGADAEHLPSSKAAV